MAPHNNDQRLDRLGPATERALREAIEAQRHRLDHSARYWQVVAICSELAELRAAVYELGNVVAHIAAWLRSRPHA